MRLPFSVTARRRGFALFLASLVWLPCLHVFLTPAEAVYRSDAGVPPLARSLVQRHLRLWNDPALRRGEVERMRRTNAEWDFMGRAFLVWSLGEIALRDPGRKAECIAAIDRIVDETLRLEQERGLHFFLMDYSRERPFVLSPPRSIFEDGEIAMMLGIRRLVEERPDFRPLLGRRVRIMAERMRKSPVLSAESYPDECWTFCNAVALASMRISDVLDGTDHAELFRDWIDTARRKLVDPVTGILVSDYTFDGRHKDGPEGSSIWMVTHCLRIVDERFARDQFERARRALAASFLGFGYAHEWPPNWRGEPDVDSGPIIPILDLSAGSSGMAFLAASSFDDRPWQAALHATLELGGFPSVDLHGELRYAAANQVGDAVLLYSTVLGPLWRKVGSRL